MSKPTLIEIPKGRRSDARLLSVVSYQFRHWSLLDFASPPSPQGHSRLPHNYGCDYCYYTPILLCLSSFISHVPMLGVLTKKMHFCNLVIHILHTSFLILSCMKIKNTQKHWFILKIQFYFFITNRIVLLTELIKCSN